MLNPPPSHRLQRYVIFFLAAMLLGLLAQLRPPAAAQEGADEAPASANSAPGEIGEDDKEATQEALPNQASRPSFPSRLGGQKLFDLLMQAGLFFMIPIFVVSLGVVTLAIERFFALRRNRVLPDGLVNELGQLGGNQGGFDPRQAYRVCQQYPSAASTVIRAMLLKVGRPHSEVEHTVGETSDREANRLYANVRWLSLAAAVAPLWGLLGTVWGMMMAFYHTTQLVQGQNKAEALAEGIYTALVTTLCGLFIAIPSAILAHYFEGRITALFHEVDELLFNLLPQIERYEGRVRFNRQTSPEDDNGSVEGSFVVGDRTAVVTPK